MTQKLIRQYVHQETDAQTVDLNSGLWQGENTDLDSRKGDGLAPPSPSLFIKYLTLQNLLHSTMQIFVLISISVLQL